MSRSTAGQPTRITVGQVTFDAGTPDAAAARMREALARGEGGHIVCLDAGHHRSVAADAELGAMVASASLVLTSSSAVVVASRLLAPGQRLLGRVAPLGLTDAVCAAGNADARRVYVVGGAPARSGVPGGGLRAAAILTLRHRGLRVAGSASPSSGIDADDAELAALVSDVRQAKPDLVLIGLPLPAGMRLVAALRAELPGAWFVESPRLVSAVVGDAEPGPGSDTGPHSTRLMDSARVIAGAVTARLTHLRAA